MFPLVADLAGRRVVVIGAGAVGAAKARQLVAGGGAVTVISPEVTGDLPPGVELVAREYRAGDLAGAVLAVSATGRPEVDDEVVAEARSRNVLVNVVDDPGRSAFYFAAVHRDGEVIVAVSTEGASPALARWVRDRVVAALPPGLGEVARRLRAERRRRHDAGQSTEGLDWSARIDRELSTTSCDEAP
ncbi:MAG: bifunctional precorrin-2 dehydrogenase/sirohydrochlorin ferrochelatase [Acidobacteriota bacterium]|nr:bifunctional precorrin-2 dehydrogenase/sirohydrochlorin ferrochelatase [Acidobacteriota bacterium]